jgi:hypothetical protein
MLRSFSVSSQRTDPQGIAFNNNGTQLFIVGLLQKSIQVYIYQQALTFLLLVIAQILFSSSQAGLTSKRNSI